MQGVNTPRDSRDYIPEQAKLENIPEQDLRDMIAGFYSDLKSRLKLMTHSNIEVNGLGYFRINRKKVEQGIRNELRIVNSPNFHFPKDSHWEQLDRLYKMQEEDQKELQRNKDIKLERDNRKQNKREQHDTDRETETGMGEEGADS